MCSCVFRRLPSVSTRELRDGGRYSIEGRINPAVRRAGQVFMTKGACLRIAAATIAACGPAVAVALVAPALAQSLPDGKGKDLVQMACLDCHDLSPITSSSFTRAEWDTVVNTMADMGANLRREDIPIVVNYLAASFPPKGNK